MAPAASAGRGCSQGAPGPAGGRHPAAQSSSVRAGATGNGGPRRVWRGSVLPVPRRRTFAAGILPSALSMPAALRHPWLRLPTTPAPGHGQPLTDREQEKEGRARKGQAFSGKRTGIFQPFQCSATALSLSECNLRMQWRGSKIRFDTTALRRKSNDTGMSSEDGCSA